MTRGRITATAITLRDGSAQNRWSKTGNCLAGKAFQVMIDNNLDFEVALYPYELATYGETGSVCQN